jgi:hypothetical protein
VPHSETYEAYCGIMSIIGAVQELLQRSVRFVLHFGETNRMTDPIAIPTFFAAIKGMSLSVKGAMTQAVW